MPSANDPTDKVRELQRALYRAAKQSGERRFHALYDKVSRMRENLTSGSMRGSRGGSLDYYGAPTYALGPKGSGTSSCRAYGGWEPARTCSLLC